MSGSLNRVFSIARNTFLEALRQKFINVLVILAVALVLSSNFFRQFDFGSSELKFITDFGLGSILFFGSILAIISTAQLFFSEIENRTALTILAKPLYRSEFVIGKFLGILAMLGVFTMLMVGLLAAMLFWRESALMDRYPTSFEEGRIVSYSGLLLYGVVELLRFGIIAGFTLFIASFSNTNLYTVIVSFFVFVICQLQYVARDGWSDISNTFLKGIVWVLALLFPNFQLFNVAELLIFPSEESLSAGSALGIVGYGVVYIIAFNVLAFVSFRSREI
ncbi:ABC transporter permease [Rubellicoccus peritrichatus]|uniref:ABC transporter permease n=1 Tax=Rubellicoccus peritrichatus TaxID=3080537 RepID=A0AAQ3L8D1_9BACT|nr:ABC transporter permease subunit [Puniceicoccus sp. CR14]WOO41195.1 ABC transporter permease [Puniceicoccus sp. CR14]